MTNCLNDKAIILSIAVQLLIGKGNLSRTLGTSNFSEETHLYEIDISILKRLAVTSLWDPQENWVNKVWTYLIFPNRRKSVNCFLVQERFKSVLYNECNGQIHTVWKKTGQVVRFFFFPFFLFNNVIECNFYETFFNAAAQPLWKHDFTLFTFFFVVNNNLNYRWPT